VTASAPPTFTRRRAAWSTWPARSVSPSHSPIALPARYTPNQGTSGKLEKRTDCTRWPKSTSSVSRAAGSVEFMPRLSAQLPVTIATPITARTRAPRRVTSSGPTSSATPMVSVMKRMRTRCPASSTQDR